MMNVDQIFRRIGEFGIYQKVIYVILNLIGITHGTRMLMAVFLVYTPMHRCALPVEIYPNDTYEIQSEYHALLIDRYIPNKTQTDQDDSPYEQCNIYLSANDSGAGRQQQSCSRWVYDKSLFIDTAMTDFNLVCDKSLYGSHSQTSQMAGFLFGVLFFGAIGDKFGRKTAFYLGVVVYLAGGLTLSWTPLVGYAFFVFIRFVNGSCSAGAFTSACVLSVEMVGPSKRLWVGVFLHLSFSVGGLVLDLIGYYVRDWFFFNIYGTLPVVIALSYWWIIPESPRWLVKHGRSKEAETILRKIAKYNGTTFPDDLVNGDPDPPLSDKPPEDKKPDGTETKRRSRGMARDFIRMFSYRVLIIRNCVQFLNWFAVAMAFYGLSFAADQLDTGSIFILFGLSCSVEFPATALVLILLDRWGRRKLLSFSQIAGGSASLLGVLTTMVVPEAYQWTTVLVAMIGKMGSSAGFILVYIYSSELYPTTVRSAGMGISSAFARLGSILASYVQQWSLGMGTDAGKALPLGVFGSFCLVAGLLCLTLPETLHKDLPEFVEDALAFGRDPAKDEHQDPQKTVEVYDIGDVKIEVDKFVPVDKKNSNNAKK